MKRIIAVFLAFAMLAVLCSCSAEESFLPARGTVENGVYTNSAFGITFSGDENWYYYSDSDIALSMGLSEEDIPSAEDTKALSEAGIIYDMYCASSLTGGTVNVTYENLAATYGEVIDIEYYLELYQIEIDYQFNSGSVTLEKNEIGVASIGSGLYPCLNVAANFGGLEIYEKIIVKKCGDWFGVVTIAALDEAELFSIEKSISFE